VRRAGRTERLIGDYYGSCTDEGKINAAGMKPLEPWLAEIDAAKDTTQLQRVMAKLHDIGVTVPFALGGALNPHEPGMVMADVSAMD